MLAGGEKSNLGEKREIKTKKNLGEENVKEAKNRKCPHTVE